MGHAKSGPAQRQSQGRAWYILCESSDEPWQNRYKSLFRRCSNSIFQSTRRSDHQNQSHLQLLRTPSTTMKVNVVLALLPLALAVPVPQQDDLPNHTPVDVAGLDTEFTVNCGQ
jgi:hypothetical protein